MRPVALLCLVFGLAAISQGQPTGAATTRGACSPANTGSNNRFTFYCNGIGAAQGAQLLNLLNQVLAKQVDPALVMAKLDEIIANQKKQAATLTEIERQRAPRDLNLSAAQRIHSRLSAFSGQAARVT